MPPAKSTTRSLEGTDRDPTQHQPFRSYDWESSPSGPEWGRVTLWLTPDHHSKSPTPWSADLDVACRDLARLMREGFFWSAANIVPEEGYVLHDLGPDVSPEWFKVARVWRLVDRQQRTGETAPLWTGRLMVDFRDLDRLKTFRIQDLSVNDVSRAWAWNADNRVVYDFSHAKPGHYVNCIYDDMPLRGWWPYPKLEDGQTYQEEENGRWKDPSVPNGQL
ncbi:hypothetical protein C8A05DRAFT_16261 [Staphylotrichum tortipilum]|uniref:Uncharacterized protein n=1 Tax=Staphylotrichum tortipilum TaxID=2831512 RepID=A0AAN6MKL2_9PEZI|nr:hypothetical protein C8A05DRAFT_16261 [Staphylotrichum longicolle]